jgi:hypothetical protein
MCSSVFDSALSGMQCGPTRLGNTPVRTIELYEDDRCVLRRVCTSFVVYGFQLYRSGQVLSTTMGSSLAVGELLDGFNNHSSRCGIADCDPWWDDGSKSPGERPQRGLASFPL